MSLGRMYLQLNCILKGNVEVLALQRSKVERSQEIVVGG